MLPVKSGTTDQVHPFRAPSGMTGMRAAYRKGTGGWTNISSPTITETDPTNRPGSFTLLMSQGTTISSGKETEVVSFYIDKADGSMQPVEFHIFLYKNMSSSVDAILGSPFQPAGAAPSSPYGI